MSMTALRDGWLLQFFSRYIRILDTGKSFLLDVSAQVMMQSNVMMIAGVKVKDQEEFMLDD